MLVASPTVVMSSDCSRARRERLIDNQTLEARALGPALDASGHHRGDHHFRARPWLAKRITKGSFQAASLATGAHAGSLGASIGIILVALFRLKHPEVDRLGSRPGP